jgi:hypothetical protein
MSRLAGPDQQKPNRTVFLVFGPTSEFPVRSGPKMLDRGPLQNGPVRS